MFFQNLSLLLQENYPPADTDSSGTGGTVSVAVMPRNKKMVPPADYAPDRDGHPERAG
jgi:hypothetical protein